MGEVKQDRSNAYWVVAILVFFSYCWITGQWDLFLVVTCVYAFLHWLFGGMLSGVKKLIPTRQSLPDKQEVAAPVMAGGNETPAIAITGDTRKNTVTATKALPKQIEFTGQQNNSIPVLYDGKQWHNITLGKDGHWGVFGTSGSGKGNVLQLVALSALSLGPDRANLTILDGKGGLDYAFALDIENATLHYGDNLDYGCEMVVQEMQRRQGILMAARKRNVNEYNKANPNNPIPLQVVIADELLSFSDDAKDNLSLFAAQCRAMGGVLVIATQYPTTDVIPSQVQANVTNRLVGRLVSSEHSRVALRRIKADNSTFEPAMIPREYPGIMVLRQDSGNEILGRSPELTESLVSNWINDLVSQYPRLSEMPQKPVQTATGAADDTITTSPLTEEETILIGDWEDEGVSRREMARRLYKMRGGTKTGYKGDGPVFQIIKNYLDNTT